jgi:hypothetical protein
MFTRRLVGCLADLFRGVLGVINALMYRHQRNILRKGHIMNKNISEKKKIQLEISGLILRNTLYIVK